MKRIQALDSLRGLASLQVVIGHYIVAIPAWGWIVYETANQNHDTWFYFFHSPIHFFVSASPAVIIFFVLSGYVLSLPYFKENGNNPDYITFFIKRILRLYIPCISAVLISIFLREYFYDINRITAFDTWVKVMWKNDNDINWLGIFTLSTSEITKYIPASWTLPIEIKLSLILPAYILLLKRMNSLLTLLSIPIIVTIFTVIGKTGIRSVLPDYTLTYYLIFFLMGSILCKYRKFSVNLINNLSNFYYLLLLLITFIIFTIDYNNWIIPAKLLVLENKLQQYLIAVSAALFIVFALSKRAKTIMESRLLFFFGNISFSLYLVHQLVFIVLVSILRYSIFSNLSLIIISFVASVIAAWLFYWIIEKKSINISHKWSYKVASFLKYRRT